MSLMPASCHLARCFCKVHHNTKAINFIMEIFGIFSDLLR